MKALDTVLSDAVSAGDVPFVVAMSGNSGGVSWSGVCNTHYWFDPARDVAGLIMTQSLPFVEPRFMKVYEAFEQGVYANIS